MKIQHHLTLKELAKRKKDAFKKKDVELFLIYHLSVARHDEMPQVPLSSLPESILTGWEEIIYNEYNRPLSEKFGSDLSSKWYYYVNQKGIPNTIKGLKSILFSLIIDSNNIENTSAKQLPQKIQSHQKVSLNDFLENKIHIKVVNLGLSK